MPVHDCPLRYLFHGTQHPVHAARSPQLIPQTDGRVYASSCEPYVTMYTMKTPDLFLCSHGAGLPSFMVYTTYPQVPGPGYVYRIDHRQYPDFIKTDGDEHEFATHQSVPLHQDPHRVVSGLRELMEKDGVQIFYLTAGLQPRDLPHRSPEEMYDMLIKQTRLGKAVQLSPTRG